MLLLIYLLFRDRKIFDFRNYVVYSECLSSIRYEKCKNFKDENNYMRIKRRLKANRQLLADVKLIHSRENQHRIALECRHSYRPVYVNIDWLVDGVPLDPITDSRFYVDRFERLIIEKVEASLEKSNFTCLVEGEPRVIYLLSVKSFHSSKFFQNNSASIVAYSILICLVMFLIFSAGLKPGSLNNIK